MSCEVTENRLYLKVVNERRKKCSSTKVTNARTGKAANGLTLEKALKSFDSKTVLRIGGKPIPRTDHQDQACAGCVPGSTG